MECWQAWGPLWWPPFEMNEDPSMVWLARRERQERHRCGCMCELHLRDLHAHHARFMNITADEAARVRAKAGVDESWWARPAKVPA